MPQIIVSENKLWEADGSPDWEGVYHQILLPSFEQLNSPRFLRNTWASNGKWTTTQVSLGLAGMAHLEILNGGIDQLAFNHEVFVKDIPSAFERLGHRDQAKILREALAALRKSAKLNADPDIDAADETLAEFVEGAHFLSDCINAARGDKVGYLFVADAAS